MAQHLDDESREMFVNTLFSFFEATGMATFDEMIVNRRTSAKKIMAEIKKLPKEKRAMLMAAMAGLLQSSSHVVKRFIRNKRESDRRALRADKRQK